MELDRNLKKYSGHLNATEQMSIGSHFGIWSPRIFHRHILSRDMQISFGIPLRQRTLKSLAALGSKFSTST